MANFYLIASYDMYDTCAVLIFLPDMRMRIVYGNNNTERGRGCVHAVSKDQHSIIGFTFLLRQLYEIEEYTSLMDSGDANSRQNDRAVLREGAGFEEQREDERQPVAKMAYVVNSIKAGFRWLGAGRQLTTDENTAPKRRRHRVDVGGIGGRRSGGNVWGVKRKARNGDVDEEMSFDVFLSSLPKVDPVDRTVNWLFSSDVAEESRDREDHETDVCGYAGRRVHRHPRLLQVLNQFIHLLHYVLYACEGSFVIYACI